jgi:hypothetical protein
VIDCERRNVLESDGSTSRGPYQVYLFTEKKLNARTVGHHTAALRFFFCKTLKRAYRINFKSGPF